MAWKIVGLTPKPMGSVVFDIPYRLLNTAWKIPNPSGDKRGRMDPPWATTYMEITLATAGDHDKYKAAFIYMFFRPMSTKLWYRYIYIVISPRWIETHDFKGWINEAN